MNKRIVISILVVTIIVAVGLELFYFKFHTYFFRNEVNEMLPIIESEGSSGELKTVVTGSFVGVDLVHKGSGTARIVDQDGKRYLRLENFEVTNGPDLYVYLSESKTPGGTLKSLDKYISLGLLKGSAGNQTYEIPESFQGYDTAVIWCQKFGVLFSYAVME